MEIKRIEKTSLLLNGIKISKCNGWDFMLAKYILDLRYTEKNYIKILGFIISCVDTISITVVSLSFLVFIYMYLKQNTNNKLSSGEIFSLLYLYRKLNV